MYVFYNMNFTSIDNLLEINDLIVSPVLESTDGWFWLLLSTFTFFLVSSIIFLVSKSFISEDNPIQKHISFLAGQFSIIALVGLGNFTAREINLSFLGASFWIVFLTIYIIVIFGLSVRYFIHFYPMEKAYYKSIK